VCLYLPEPFGGERDRPFRGQVRAAEMHDAALRRWGLPVLVSQRLAVGRAGIAAARRSTPRDGAECEAGGDDGRED
jgi:hypothetical protein